MLPTCRSIVTLTTQSRYIFARGNEPGPVCALARSIRKGALVRTPAECDREVAELFSDFFGNPQAKLMLTERGRYVQFQVFLKRLRIIREAKYLIGGMPGSVIARDYRGTTTEEEE